MTSRAPHICGRLECTTIVPYGQRFCQAHAKPAWQGARTASSRRTGNRRWKVQRAKALQRDGHTCQVRGPRCTVGATEVDHIVPVSAGGTDDLSNLQSVCRADHNAKTQAEARGDIAAVRPRQPAPVQIPKTIILKP